MKKLSKLFFGTYMKKFLMLFLIIVLLVAPLTACGKKTSNAFKIVCLNASFGDEWINSLVEKFKAANPGVEVELTAISNASSLIQQHLNSKNNTDDLYICVDTQWKSYVAQGMFLELDDLLEEEVDGIKIKNKVSSEYQNSLYFTKSNGDKHCYRLPWTSGIGGIYYNKKMFEANGWDQWLKDTYQTNTTGTPETYDQLVALCGKINTDRIQVDGDRKSVVKPFSYTGANSDYFDYLVYDWWGQLAGAENIHEFLKYDSAENFDTSKNATYNELKNAVTYWQQIFCSSDNVIANSESKSAVDAQKEFINGYSAMMVNGDWLYNDTLSYTKNSTTISSKFELGTMKTPLLTNATYSNISYVIGEDQFIAIPKTSTHVDLAKSFIKLIVSDEGVSTFLNEAHGFLAFDSTVDLSTTTTNSFMLNSIETRNSYTTKFTNWSNNRKYLCNYIDIWATNANRPYLNLINNVSDVAKSFTSIATVASSGWKDWTDKSK